MSDDLKPLYVRLPAVESDRLEAAAAATGKSKRQLVSDAVRQHLDDGGLNVGRIALREEANEVLTLGEAAALLRLVEDQVAAAADAGEIPGRRIGGEWRFSRVGLLAWLAPQGDSPDSRASRHR